MKMFKVCSDCINELKNLKQRHQSLSVIKNGAYVYLCQNKPKCFDQPERSKREDLDIKKCPLDQAQFKILGQSEAYCCFAGIPNEFKCNKDWLKEFVKDMKQKCIYCSKMRGDHISKMRCSEHNG